MILTIGRVGLDVELSAPRDINHAISQGGAEVVMMTGHIKDTTTLVEANALRTELLAQVGQIVPVTLSIDSTVDGYYRLLSASVDLQHALGSLQSTGFFPFSIQLEKKEGAAFEVAFSGGLVPNAHTITAQTNKGLIGIAVNADLLWTQDPSGSILASLLESEDGAVRCYYQLDSGDYGLRYAIAPADFYGAACEVYIDGRLRAGIGRAFASPDPVVVTNGQVELTFNAGENGDVRIRHYADSAWETAKRYHFRTDMSNVNGDWTECRIVRNDPEEVIVQLTKPRATSGEGFLVLNVTVRRGWRMALFQFKCDSADDLGVNRQAAEAASALGSAEGIVATAADGEDNKYLIVCPQAHDTYDLASTAGLKLTTPGGTITFAIGSVVNSAAPDTGADTQDLVDQFFNFLEPRQLVISGVL